jgi:hypothetical protein
MNPFTPGFGTTPRVLVDRQQIVDLLARAFLPGFDPHRATWLKAPRGTGKTVLLNEVQDRAQQAGWIVVQEDAQSADLCDRVVDQLLALRQPLLLRGVSNRPAVKCSAPAAASSSPKRPPRRDHVFVACWKRPFGSPTPTVC